MKVKPLRSMLLSAILVLLMLPAYSQRNRIRIYSTSGDSISCGANLSAYRTFFKLELYHDAYPTWLRVFNECPDFSELIYVDGATMYRSFIESSAASPLREARIDTLMLIYERRMEYFGGEGNVLGRKGKDLLNYRGSDIMQVQQANEMLRRSIEIQGQESQESVLQLFISSGVVLNRKGHLDQEQLITDYVLVMGNLVPLEKLNSRWGRTRSRITEMLLREELLSCKALDNFFGPLLEKEKENISFQEMLISTYSALDCEGSPVLSAAWENLYHLDPGSGSAHTLALQFIARDDLERAAYYLQAALKDEEVDDETRAQWYYELAVVSNALEDFCRAIEYSREAIRLKDDFGQAYMLMGDAIISSRKNLGNDFQKRTAFWVAWDMYETASSVDPALSEEAGKKRSRCMLQFPDNEDIFFRDIREGEAYLVEGCINDTTVVRSRQ